MSTVKKIPELDAPQDRLAEKKLENKNVWRESEIEVLASIRERIRNLSVDRQAEVFSDFQSALDSGKIGYLADTIANWAAGGGGYRDRGFPVNVSTASELPDFAADPEAEAIWQEYIADQK